VGYAERATVRRVREALEAKGLKPGVVELDNTARSAREAAEALGIRVEQIVKSLVFRASGSGRPVLVAASGPNRVDESRISETLGEPIEKADANFVREKTGYSIGGVPPVGHIEAPVVFVDQALLDEDEVWAAAGHTHAVFPLAPEELVRITGGRVVSVGD
jgi:prolyl-tRNA editing enzyme YbaK/EbsC (Cys-tRNA(Pro) deacylase)